MRYTFDIFKVKNNVTLRIGTETQLSLVAESIDRIKKDDSYWYVTVTDNLDNSVFTLANDDELDNFGEMEARSIWLGREAKDVITSKVLANLAAKKDWKPFAEEECGIHLKDSKLTDNNVKTAAAVNKPRMSAVPTCALMELGRAMQNGADKYGAFNWRTTSVSATVFYDAIMRHVTEWYAGENDAQDSKVPHLAHIMANCAIILDAEKHGVFNDDRNIKK